MAEIVTLPKWKRGASAYERLSELALLAKEQPEKFDKFAIVYVEKLKDGRIKPRRMTFMEGGLSPGILEALGLFELAKLVEWTDAHK